MVNSLLLTLCNDPFSATKVMSQMGMMTDNETDGDGELCIRKYVTCQANTESNGHLPTTILGHSRCGNLLSGKDGISIKVG